MPDLERELRGLAASVVWPATPDLAPVVRRRVESEPARSRRPMRRVLVLAVALLVVAAGAVLAVPSARTAVLEWLGLRGVTVERVESVPSVPERAPDIGVGDEVTRAEADSLAPFPLPDPLRAGLGEPDEIRYTALVADGQVAFLWRDEDRAVETLLTVFRASLDDGFIEKMAGPDSPVVPVGVEGRRGIWIAGAPHFFMYVLPSGEGREETARLAGNTLLWEDGDRLLRLEGELTLGQARRMAVALSQ